MWHFRFQIHWVSMMFWDGNQKTFVWCHFHSMQHLFTYVVHFLKNAPRHRWEALCWLVSKDNFVQHVLSAPDNRPKLCSLWVPRATVFDFRSGPLHFFDFDLCSKLPLALFSISDVFGVTSPFLHLLKRFLLFFGNFLYLFTPTSPYTLLPHWSPFGDVGPHGDQN